MTAKEQRQGRRKYSQGVVEFYEDAGLLMMGVGRLLDLSITGALVESALRLSPSQMLRFRLRLAQHQPLDLKAQVVHSLNKNSTTAYGIQFIALSPEELGQIQSYL